MGPRQLNFQHLRLLILVQCSICQQSPTHQRHLKSQTTALPLMQPHVSMPRSVKWSVHSLRTQQEHRDLCRHKARCGAVISTQIATVTREWPANRFWLHVVSLGIVRNDQNCHMWAGSAPQRKYSSKRLMEPGFTISGMLSIPRISACPHWITSANYGNHLLRIGPSLSCTTNSTVKLRFWSKGSAVLRYDRLTRDRGVRVIAVHRGQNSYSAPTHASCFD